MRKSRVIAAVSVLLFAVGLVPASADVGRPDSQLQCFSTAFRDFPARGVEGDVTLVVDNECELTSELAGTWVLEERLTKELFPQLAEPREEQPNKAPVTKEFTISLEGADSKALTKLRDWITVAFAESETEYTACKEEFRDAARRVLAVGEISSKRAKRHFAVVQWRGNLAMLVFRENGSIDVIYVSMGCDRKGGNDYLFMREDRHPNEAYKRKAEVKDPKPE